MSYSITADARRACIVWMASFLLDVSTFAPLEALCLSVDYYNLVFKGQQAAVRIAASYDAALILTLILCYYLETRLYTRQSTAPTATEAELSTQRLSGHRIISRHVGVIALLLLLVVYAEFVATGPGNTPSWALQVLIIIAALIGLLDGLSLGAVYGEAGIVGPSSAHAVVAGQACGFLLLATLRGFSKAVLPETPKGLRQSFCMFFATTALLLLVALIGYLRVVRPAVQDKLCMQRLPVRATSPPICQLDPPINSPKRRYTLQKPAASPETCRPDGTSQPDIDWVLSIKEARNLRVELKMAVGSKATPLVILPVPVTSSNELTLPVPVTSSNELTGKPGHTNTFTGIQDVCVLVPDAQGPAGPRYLKPGAGVFAITASVMRDHWQFAAAIVLTYAANAVIFPAVLGYMHWPTVGSWYPLLLQLSDGIGDLAGKLLPVWHPPKPKLFIGCVSTARALLLVPVFLAMLYWGAPPAVWFCVTFIWSLSGWYESTVFALACDGLHPNDAYQIESLLAFMLQLGSLSGALLSLLLDLGPWAASAA